jgi:hypothetical protein
MLVTMKSILAWSVTLFSLVEHIDVPLKRQ